MIAKAHEDHILVHLSSTQRRPNHQAKESFLQHYTRWHQKRLKELQLLFKLKWKANRLSCFAELLVERAFSKRSKVIADRTTMLLRAYSGA